MISTTIKSQELTKLENRIKAAMSELRRVENLAEAQRKVLGNLLIDYKAMSRHGEYTSGIEALGVCPRISLHWRNKAAKKQTKPNYE